MGDVVHGGAIAALLDTASMAAAWADDTVPEAVAGATVSMSVDYVSAARGVRPDGHRRRRAPRPQPVLLRGDGDRRRRR